MANAYSVEAESDLTPHQQSQLVQLSACIGYGSQLILGEEKEEGNHFDRSAEEDEEGEPDRTESLSEQRLRLRRTRHGREESFALSKNDRQHLNEKKDEPEAKHMSTGTADFTGSSSQSPVARAPSSSMSETRNQLKSSPGSNNEEEDWECQRAQKLIGRHLKRMSQQEQILLFEESQKGGKTKGQGKAGRATKKPKSSQSAKPKKRRKPSPKKLKDPPKEHSPTPAAGSERPASAQQEPQAKERIDESTKNDEIKIVTQRGDDSGDDVNMV
jgi:hypothetical protein